MLADLASVGCDLVTVGQYLRPRRPTCRSRATTRPPSTRLAETGRALGLAHVEAGPLVRSSFEADRVAEAAFVPADTNPQVLAIRADTTSGEGISHQEDLAARRPGDRDRLPPIPEDAADAAAAVVRRALAETEDAEVAAGREDPAAAARLPLLLERPRLPGRMGGVLGLGLGGGAPLPELRVAPGRAVRRRGPRRLRRALNDGTETLLIALRDTTRANMEAAVERLIDAIKLDLIEPMDF